MFAGHLAVALASKKVDPEIPVAGAVAATYWLDLLWPILLLLGVESVRVSPGDTAVTSLAFESYPWSHSMLMALVWAGLGTGLARVLRRTWRTSLTLGGLVFSHWILDFVTHRPDLPLWPGGPEYGLSLWNSVPGTLAVEGGLFAAGIWMYTRATRPRDGVGRWALAALLVLVGGIWVSQPWAPPPPSATAVAVVGLVMWVMLPWSSWIEHHRAPTPKPGGG
jgi:hypothetical protein